MDFIIFKIFWDLSTKCNNIYQRFFLFNGFKTTDNQGGFSNEKNRTSRGWAAPRLIVVVLDWLFRKVVFGFDSNLRQGWARVMDKGTDQPTDHMAFGPTIAMDGQDADDMHLYDKNYFNNAFYCQFLFSQLTNPPPDTRPPNLTPSPWKLSLTQLKLCWAWQSSA